MVFNQISQPRQRVSLRIAFSELDALSGSKTSGCTTSPHLRFSNHDRSGGSQTTPPMARALGPVQRPWQIRWFSNYFSLACHRMRFSNHGRSGGSQTPVLGSLPNISSVTMADRAVLKPVGVDMPFELGIPISKNCKICQVFLFLRPARSFFRSGSRISASVYSRPDGGMGTL